MNGLDYARRRTLPEALRWPDVTPALRTSLGLIAATLLTTLGICAGEQHRLTELEARLGVLREQESAVTLAARNAGTVAQQLAGLRELAQRLASARRETIMSTNAAILIGNGLPPRTWLTELDALPSGSWTIAGKSTALDQIGATITALSRLDRTAAVRLVSVTTLAQPGSSYAFVITWDRGK